jgi:hypothetical protein
MTPDTTRYIELLTRFIALDSDADLDDDLLDEMDQLWEGFSEDEIASIRAELKNRKECTVMA